MTYAALRTTVVGLAALVCHPAGIVAQGASPKAVAEPRDWLTKQQLEDGRWPAPELDDGSSADIRATSIALLAYLGGGRSTELGPHRDVVRRGIGWLVGQQGERGRLGTASSLLDHAIATCTLTHAVVLGAEKRAPAAQRAIDYLELHGNPGHPEFDLQIAAWRALVREAARPLQPDAEPLLTIDEDRFDVLRITLANLANDPIGSATDVELAAELAARVALDRRAASKSERVAALRDVILGAERRFDDPATAPDPRATFFASWALYILGGSGWKNWSTQLDRLRTSQRADGELRGTFDPGGSEWSHEGGRVTSTALGIVTLQVYYRYTRLIR